jgi:hypothetical protein
MSQTSLRLRWVVPASLLALLAAGACGDDDVPKLVKDKGPGPVARFALGPGAAPDFLDVPFPSDVYLSGGRYVSPIPGFDKVVRSNASFLTHELGKLNGFSRIAMALFYVDAPAEPKDDEGEVAAAQVDPASLPADEAACVADTSAVFLVDLEATDPAKARVKCRAAFHPRATTSKTRATLGVGPARGVLLEEGHRYAAVLTTRVKDTKGRPLTASASFAKAIEDKAGLYGAAYDKVLATIGGALGKDAVVSLAPYTTQKVTDELFALRDAAEDAPAPPLSWAAGDLAPMTAARFSEAPLAAGFTATLDAWLGVVPAGAKLPDGSDDPDADLPARAHDKIAAFGTAVFQAPNYLVSKPDGYSALDHATFAKDAAGKIVPAPDRPTNKIWVSFAIPRGAVPAAGFPAVIVQHGLSSSRAFAVELANVFASKGWATVAIDSVTFGARAPSAKYQVDATSDWADAPGATYKGGDGLSDLVNGERNGSFDLFGGLKDIGAIRDQLRQAELDTAYLVKLLRSGPDLAPLKTGADTPKIDPDRIVYIGESLGGIEGAVAAAIEPHVKAWVLGVTGGGILTELAARSPNIGFQLAQAGGLNFGFVGDRFDESHPMLPIAQAIAEGGDPIAYAHRLVTAPRGVKGAPGKARNLLFTEVVFDELVTNESSEALARAAGYGLATPNVGPNAGVNDVKNPGGGQWRVPLADIAADGAGVIHDTPGAGATAVLVQISPAHHGAELTRSKAKRSFALPFNRLDGTTPERFEDAKRVEIRSPYREVQAMIVRFFDDALASKVPGVTGFKAPARDADDDGTPDANDPNPMGK